MHQSADGDGERATGRLRNSGSALQYTTQDRNLATRVNDLSTDRTKLVNANYNECPRGDGRRQWRPI